MPGCNHAFFDWNCGRCRQDERDRQYKKMHQEREGAFADQRRDANRRNADYQRRHDERMRAMKAQQRDANPPPTIWGIPIAWIFKTGVVILALVALLIALVVSIAFQVLKALLPVALVAALAVGAYYGCRWLMTNRPPQDAAPSATFVGIPQPPAPAGQPPVVEAPAQAYPPPPPAAG